MHCSRMHTACLLTMGVSGGCVWRCVCPVRLCTGVCPPPRPRGRPPWTQRQTPPVDRQTPVKTLPCPKLRLLTVIRISFSHSHVHIRKPKSVTCVITHLNVSILACMILLFKLVYLFLWLQL